MRRIVAPSHIIDAEEDETHQRNKSLHDHTYGITSGTSQVVVIDILQYPNLLTLASIPCLYRPTDTVFGGILRLDL